MFIPIIIWNYYTSFEQVLYIELVLDKQYNGLGLFYSFIRIIT